MYVRSKTQKGIDYYYLVKSVREGKRVRQKVVQYLGSEIPTQKELKQIIGRYEKQEKTKQRSGGRPLDNILARIGR